MDAFLHAVINDINSSTIHFKLSPAYVFYLSGRFFTSQRNKPDRQTEQRLYRIFDKIVSLIQDIIEVDSNLELKMYDVLHDLTPGNHESIA